MPSNRTDRASDLLDLLDQWQRVRDLCRETTGLSLWLLTSEGRLDPHRSALPPFCLAVQATKQGYHRCEDCYRAHCFDATDSGEVVLFECHAGLTVLAIPIVVDDNIVGAAIGSGVLTQPLDAMRLRERAELLGLEARELVEAAACLPQSTTAELRAAAKMIRGLLDPLARTITRYDRLLGRASSLADLLDSYSDFFVADPLTGVYNAQHLLRRLREELTRAERYGQTLSFLVVKVNGIADINAAHGYTTGDNVLKSVAEALRSGLRRTEVVARLRGDKFAAVLPETTQAQAHALARRIREMLSRIEPAERGLPEGVQLSVSIGIASNEGERCTEDQLVQRALVALDQAGRAAQEIAIYCPARGSQRGSSRRRVVVTGVGVVSSIGVGKEAFLEGLRSGRSGVRALTRFDAAFCTSRIAAEVRDFDPKLYMPEKAIKRSGWSTQMGIGAAKMAVEDARLDLSALDAGRIGTFVGSAINGVEFAEGEAAALYRDGVNRINPFLSLVVFAGAVSSEISMALGTRGPSINVSTGCSAATDAIGYAYQSIRDGNADVCVAGGTEAPLSPMVVGSFASLRALSTRNDEPETASRPFDKTRDGFVIGEGAAVVVLEELQHALARGAHIYGEILGYAATGDAYHMTRPAPDGTPAAQAILLALRDAGVAPSDVQYVNAHGSSTPLNDRTETMVIKTVFGDHAYNLAISSTKSQVGHPIGASGGIELIATLLGMDQGFLPATINYRVPDPECDLDYVPNQVRAAKFDLAISNSFGFGGKNAILVVGRY
jgi:3-oxoacyl-[acyl-carrier-protein] synthase II